MNKKLDFEATSRECKLMLVKIWFALGSSMIVYSSVIFFLLGVPRQFPSRFDFSDNLALVLFGLSIVCAVSSYLFYKNALSDKKARKYLASVELNGEFTELQNKALKLISWSFSPYLITWLLNESIAVFGVILAFMEERSELMLPFLILALFLHIVTFPKGYAGRSLDEVSRL